MKWGASLINTVPETLRYADPGNGILFCHLKSQNSLALLLLYKTRFLAATAIFVVNPHPKIFCTKICKGERNANFKMHSLLFSLAITYSWLVLQIEKL